MKYSRLLIMCIISSLMLCSCGIKAEEQPQSQETLSFQEIKIDLSDIDDAVDSIEQNETEPDDISSEAVSKITESYGQSVTTGFSLKGKTNVSSDSTNQENSGSSGTTSFKVSNSSSEKNTKEKDTTNTSTEKQKAEANDPFRQIVVGDSSGATDFYYLSDGTPAIVFDTNGDDMIYKISNQPYYLLGIKSGMQGYAQRLITLGAENGLSFSSARALYRDANSHKTILSVGSDGTLYDANNNIVQ